jgi:rare lipoprotein A
VSRATACFGVSVLVCCSSLLLTACGAPRQTTVNVPPPPAIVANESADQSQTATDSSEPSIPASRDEELHEASVSHGKVLFVETGLASWYGAPYNHRRSSDGTVYNMHAMTAAHRTLPLGSTVRVTNLKTGHSVVVRITDRGPFVHGRIIDLSLAAAKATGVYRAGVAKVRVEAYAAPVSASASTSKVPTIPGGRWCVQIGAFLTEEDAITLKNDLMRRYTTAKVIEFAGPTGHWVRINPKFPDKATAEQVADSIHVPDAEPYLIRLD